MKLLSTLLFFCSCLNGQTWLQIADFPGLERDDGVCVNVNDKLYFGSGLTVGWGYAKDFYVLDPASNAWTALTPMPEGAQRQYACAFAATGAFFVLGGDGINGPLNDLYKYSIAQGTWTVKASKPGNGIFGANCLQLGDKIIIVGGKQQGNAQPTNEVWEYTIGTDTWVQKNNFPFGGRFRSSTAVINNTGYMLFGLDQDNLFRKEMYRYNQLSDSWTKILDFPQPRGRAYATLNTIEDKLILFGGYDSLNVYYKDVWYFDPGTSTWTQEPDFVSFARKGGMAAVAGNKFYYSCGINVSDTRLKESWTFDFPVSIHEQVKSDLFNVYPNPVRDILTVTLNSADRNNYDYALADICGKELKKLSTTGNELNIADLMPGIYFVKISLGNVCLGRARFVKE